MLSKEVYYNNCKCCGRYDYCRKAWPAPNGTYYGDLCGNCVKRLYHPEQWEQERLELIPVHSE